MKKLYYFAILVIIALFVRWNSMTDNKFVLTKILIRKIMKMRVFETINIGFLRTTSRAG